MDIDDNMDFIIVKSPAKHLGQRLMADLCVNVLQNVKIEQN